MSCLGAKRTSPDLSQISLIAFLNGAYMNTKVSVKQYRCISESLAVMYKVVNTLKESMWPGKAEAIVSCFHVKRTLKAFSEQWLSTGRVLVPFKLPRAFLQVIALTTTASNKNQKHPFVLEVFFLATIKKKTKKTKQITRLHPACSVSGCE